MIFSSKKMATKIACHLRVFMLDLFVDAAQRNLGEQFGEQTFSLL
jgi:hypothetical protein